MGRLYTIGEASEELGMPASTIRFYERNGLIPNMRRTDGGIRQFDEDDLEWMRFVERLKVSGMPIKEIREYIKLYLEGDSTIEARRRIVYDPWVIVNHHRRALFGAHLRQLGRYAFHRGYFVKRYPSNSRHLAYFVPSAFVLYLLLGVPAAAALLSLGRPGTPQGLAGLLLLAPLALYAALVLLTTLARNPFMWLLTAAGVVATHVCYGVQFVRGLCARRAPCEFIGKDHV